MMDYTLWGAVQEVWLIAAMSVLAVAVALERLAVLWQFLERARTLTDTVTRCLSRGAVAEARAACERSKSPLADVMLTGFERAGRTSHGGVVAVVDRGRQRAMLDMRARLWVLATIGATAPFIGLYGTVVGIMDAFAAIGKEQQAGFSVVSAGISKALIHTAAGLAIALVAIVIYNYLNQRIGRIAIEVRLMLEEFLETLTGPDAGTPETGRATSQADPLAASEPDPSPTPAPA